MWAWDIDYWFCCLNPRERVLLRDTSEGLVLTLFIGIPKTLWDAFWIPTIHGSEKVREAFLSIYKLEIVTIPLGGEDTLVVRPRDGYADVWLDWSIFMVSPAAACLSGCQQSTVP